MKTILLYTLICALAAVALLMLGLGIKMICKRHGEFKRHCSSMDPYTGERAGCTCKLPPTAQCSHTRKYSPLEVNSRLLDEMGGGLESEQKR